MLPNFLEEMSIGLEKDATEFHFILLQQIGLGAKSYLLKANVHNIELKQWTKCSAIFKGLFKISYCTYKVTDNTYFVTVCRLCRTILIGEHSTQMWLM